MNILLLYSSRFGHTEKIAHTLEAQWTQAGAYVTTLNLAHTIASAVDVSAFDQIVIGASIRYGHYAPALAQWVNHHLEALNNRPSAFFSVSILANKAHRNTPQTHTYTRKFFEHTAWRPSLIGIFPGELDYRKYHLIDRYLMKFVMWLNKGATHVATRIEFTDWQQVRAFGTTVLTLSSPAKPATTLPAGRTQSQ